MKLARYLTRNMLKTGFSVDVNFIKIRDKGKWIRHCLWMYLVIGFCLPKFCIAGHHEKRLLQDLLDPYNTLERPVVNESDPLQLSFGLTLMQIIDVDEKNQMLVTNIWLKLEWNDMNLRWNTSEYGGVKDLRIPPHRIWKPDVLMYNSADEGFDGTYPTNVVVRSNGSCLYVPPGIFKSTCKIDITWFPFDDQTCEMKFGSWTYDGFQVPSYKMEKSYVSKRPTLEVISEIEPHSYNAERTTYNKHHPAQITTVKVYRTSTHPLPSQTQGGHINQGYTGSSQNSINRDSQNSLNRDGSTPSVGGVYREQYWICSEPLRCRNWTKRERILFIVLFVLSTIVLGLVAGISLMTRSSEDKTQSPPGWFPWL